MLQLSKILSIFTEEELVLISGAIELCSGKFSTNVPASFDHRDLGTHNVIAIASEGGTKVGAIIDFGLSLL